MKRGSKAIVVLILILVAAGASSPFIFHAAALRWAKYPARRKMSDLPPRVIQNLNTVPAVVTLPDTPLDPAQVSTFELGNYSVRVPKPHSQSRGETILRLTYPRFEVFILMPRSEAQMDDLARQMQCKDYFDMQSAIYHTRWSDLDAQRDLPSLRRFLLTISEKGGNIACTEQFEGARLRGFIFAPEERGTRLTLTEMRATHIGCGIHFSDRKRKMTIADVHQFLSVFDIKPIAHQSPSAAATRP